MKYRLLFEFPKTNKVEHGTITEDNEQVKRWFHYWNKQLKGYGRVSIVELSEYKNG